MTSYTPSNGFAVLQPFDRSIFNTWGTPNSTNETLADEAIDGLVTIDVSNRQDYTLSIVAGAPDERRYRMKTFTGSLSSPCNVHMPNLQKVGYARNATSGGQTLVLTAGGGGASLTLPNDNLWYLYWTDGFNNVSSLNVGVGGQATTGDLTVGGAANVTGNISAGGAIAAGGGIFSASGGITAQGTDPTGAQFRAIGGGRAMFIHNDGASTFFMQTAAGQPFGSWDSIRPFAWDMGTGAVTIDGSAAGTHLGGTLSVQGSIACLGALTVGGEAPVLNDGGTYAINITGNAGSSGGGTISGNQIITGNLTTNGKTFFGTSAQFYADPNSTGSSQLLNFALNQFIAYVPGSGFAISTSGVINLSAGNAVNAFGNMTVSGFLTIGGSTNISGNGCYVIQPSVVTSPGAWGPVAVSCNVAGSYVGQGFFTTSDARAKEAIETIGPMQAREWVNRAHPVTFRWKDGGKSASGFIAQEEWINGRGAALVPVPDARPEYAENDGIVAGGFRLTRDYDHDIAYLTAALQHVMRELDELKAIKGPVARAVS